MTPGPWVFALLALAAYRVWQLLAQDTILDPIRDRVVSGKNADFVGCVWCFGFWIAVVWWLAWREWEDGTVVAAVPFALSTVVGVVGMAVSTLADK